MTLIIYYRNSLVVVDLLWGRHHVSQNVFPVIISYSFFLSELIIRELVSLTRHIHRMILVSTRWSENYSRNTWFWHILCCSGQTVIEYRPNRTKQCKRKWPRTAHLLRTRLLPWQLQVWQKLQVEIWWHRRRRHVASSSISRSLFWWSEL